MIVADTSLIVHLFNETDNTKIAQQVRIKDANWIMPTIWQDEYTNVISKFIRINNYSIKEAIQNIDRTRNLLKNHEVKTDNIEALKLSIEFNISVYDAHFLSLCLLNNTLLVTEDKEVLKKCSQYAISMTNFLKL